MQSKYWLAALALGLSLQAGATSFVVTTDGIVNTVDGTSDVTSSSFVASAGAIRGAHLEAAFLHIRRQQPTLQMDDMQLAQAILAI